MGATFTAEPRKIQAAIVMKFVGLAMLGSLAAGQALAASLDPLAPCKALVAQVAARGSLMRVSGRTLLEREEVLAPLIQIGKRSPPTPELSARAAYLLPEWNTLGAQDLQRVDRNTWRAALTQGTLDCADEAFFRVGEDGRVTRLATPPSYEELCWTSGRDMGSFRGTPALVETEILDRPQIGMDIEITPWAGDWQASCRASLRYDDVFTLTETFCGDRKLCRAGTALAPKLARAFSHDRNGSQLESVSPPSPKGLTALGDIEAARLPRDGESGRPILASFGAKPHTEFPEYSDEMQTVAVQVAGQPLLANVGIGGVAWRAMGDYLITFYRKQGATFRPVAGYVVRRCATTLSKAETSIPTPWVNPH
jgi:hypothetical protein